jgi:hypothetical protein
MKLALIPAVLALVPLPAPAADYTLFIWETAADIALRADPGTDGQAYWAAYAAFGDSLAASGALRGGAPLDAAAPPAGAQGSGGLLLGGYFRLEADTPEQARALAQAAPALVRGGAVTLAPHAAAPTMASN